jgi:hypothetical protein
VKPWLQNKESTEMVEGEIVTGIVNVKDFWAIRPSQQQPSCQARTNIQYSGT